MALPLGRQHTQALKIDTWFHLGAGWADKEIYVLGVEGGMLHRVKLIHAENVRSLQFLFMWGTRKRL